MTTGHERPSAAGGEPIAIVAAGGAIPVEVASAAMAAGRKVLVIGLEGEADERLRAYPYVAIKWGQIGRIEKLVRENGGHEVVLIGSVAGRPDFSSIGVDLGTLRLLPRILKGMIGGDDTVLGNLVRYLEERGLKVVGAHELAPSLAALPGRIGGPRAPAAALEDGRLAMHAARTIGDLDIGQGAVAVNGHVVALEAAEGTDAMLERVETLRAVGRIRWKGRAGVLAKCAKPKQDLRVDMPTIGPRTVAAVAKAGLAGIVIEPRRVMIADRAATLAAAETSGTFIVAGGEEKPP
ncbi:LpxI family protein [soil metagenome]